MVTGIDLIKKEREEQINKHGRSLKYDALENEHCELSLGAVMVIDADETLRPTNWDEKIIKKMVKKPYKERLIIAGALLAAELVRLIAIENNQL